MSAVLAAAGAHVPASQEATIMGGLDRSNPMPLWAQLEAELRRRLDDGEFTDRFPTDKELVAQYGVSRHTVREAIRHLNRAGILRRERGRGTVVDTAEFEQPLGALYSLFDSVESSGVEQRSDVITNERVTDDVAADHLGLAPDTPLYHLARVRYAGDEPLALDRAWLPFDVAGPLLDSDFRHIALYDELERRCDVRPDAGWERIAPLVPCPADCDALQMRRGDAAFFLERFSSSGGTPLEWRTTIIRGDRYRFLSTFEAGVAPSLVAQRDEH
jgi:GntR family transcriptional regulator